MVTITSEIRSIVEDAVGDVLEYERISPPAKFTAYRKQVINRAATELRDLLARYTEEIWP